MATTKIPTGIRFEEEMLRKITFIAKRNRRSLNAQLEFLAQECIEKYEKENGEIHIPVEDRYLRTSFYCIKIKNQAFFHKFN